MTLTCRCGKEFDPTKSWQKYCSKKCGRAAYQERKHDKLLAYWTEYNRTNAEARRSYWHKVKADPAKHAKHRENSRKWRQENKERTNAYKLEWKKKNPEKHKAITRRTHQKNSDHYRCLKLRRNYGITLQDYNDMLAAQNGVCAICKLPETTIEPRTGKVRTLSVDHCHDTGRVRGLLCAHCNNVLGRARDDIAILTEAISYLQRTARGE